MASDGVAWSAIPEKVVEPLLLSIAIAYGISLALALAGSLADRLRRGSARPASAAPGGSGPSGLPTSPGGVAVAEAPARTAVEPEHSAPAAAPHRLLTGAHWLTSGATGFARGLNDTPKMVAIGAFALVPAGMTTWQIMLVVAFAMAAGSLFGGMRVAESLGEGVVRMDHREGFFANLTTTVLVGLGAAYGLPMSTTHVSTGAIAGSAGPNLSRISAKTLRGFLIAWVVTPPFAGVVAALVYLVAR
jgi:PiT family inorganic phosphate transporter